MGSRHLSLALLVLAALGAPARAQAWRPVEVQVQEAMVNAALVDAHAAALDARRDAPAREPASLGEALKGLAAAFMHVGRPRLTLHDDRVVLQATIRIEAIFDRTWIDVDFDFVPRVTAPNVVELTVVRARERWQGRDWEERVGRDLERNARSLVDAMGSAGGVAARLEGGEGAPLRIVADLGGVPALAGVELLELTSRAGTLTARGRTTRDALTLSFDPSDVGDVIRKLGGGASGVLSWDAWVDVGREHPGHVTLHSTADLPWLPAVSYRAVFRLEAAGPHRVRLTFARLDLGGDFTDGFLSRTGIKGWIMRRLYARLDALEGPADAAYERGEGHVRLSHDPARPEVRTIDLRPGWAGDVLVRPGFALDALTVHPGRLEVTARLTPGDVEDDRRAPAVSSRGLSGALGAMGE